jgi:hypothetical protein
MKEEENIIQIQDIPYISTQRISTLLHVLYEGLANIIKLGLPVYDIQIIQHIEQLEFYCWFDVLHCSILFKDV